MEDNKKLNPFIVQTARDYDLDYEVVEDIFNKYQSNFYEKLEEHIKTKSQLR